MTAINVDQPATASTSTWLDYTASEYCNMLDNFFTLEDPPQLPFYDTPQGVIFSGHAHRKVQAKQRILEYRAKY